MDLKKMIKLSTPLKCNTVEASSGELCDSLLSRFAAHLYISPAAAAGGHVHLIFRKSQTCFISTADCAWFITPTVAEELKICFSVFFF